MRRKGRGDVARAQASASGEGQDDEPRQPQYRADHEAKAIPRPVISTFLSSHSKVIGIFMRFLKHLMKFINQCNLTFKSHQYTMNTSSFLTLKDVETS